MNFFSYIKEAIGMLWQNKMRSFLSLLGIMIGISSVVILTAIGNGMKNQITKDMASTQTIIRIERWSIPQYGMPPMQEGIQWEGKFSDISIEQQVTGEQVFTREMVALLQKVFGKTVKAIVPNIEFRGKMPIIAGRQGYANIQLSDGGLFQARDITAMRGMLFNGNTKENVAVIGKHVVQEFDNKDPVGKTIYINDIAFTVIGILSETKDYNVDGSIFIPSATAMERFGKQNINRIEVYAHRVEDMEEIQRNLGFFLMKYSNAFSPSELNFHLATDKKFIESITKQIGQIALFISGIAGISLLVWGIGIMNIMLVSVTERTREIGIRKAIGARRRDIILQFLTESAVLSLLWGVLAVLFSFAVTTLIEFFVPQLKADISLDIIFIATSFSVGMWVFFGLMPAWKAAKMQAIEALRFE